MTIATEPPQTPPEPKLSGTPAQPLAQLSPTLEQYVQPETLSETPPMATMPADVLARIVVTSEYVNIRSGPGTNYAVLGRLQNGQKASVTGKSIDGAWWRIDFAGQTGWVSASLTQFSGIPEAVPTVTEPILAAPPAIDATAPPIVSTDPTQGSHTFLNDKVDPPWWPCKQGQVKGNLNSGIYHAPGQRDYAKTYNNVRCFDTATEAEASGFRPAKR